MLRATLPAQNLKQVHQVNAPEFSHFVQKHWSTVSGIAVPGLETVAYKSIAPSGTATNNSEYAAAVTYVNENSIQSGLTLRYLSRTSRIQKEQTRSEGICTAFSKEALSVPAARQNQATLADSGSAVAVG